MSSNLSYLEFIAEKSYQIECEKVLNKRGQLSELINIFQPGQTSLKNKTYRFLSLAPLYFLMSIVFKLNEKDSDLSLTSKIPDQDIKLFSFKNIKDYDNADKYKSLFQDVFPEQIQKAQETIQKIETEVSKIYRDRISITNPLWKDSLLTVITLLENLRKQITELIDGDKYRIHFTSFRGALIKWGEEEIKGIDKNLRLFNELLRSKDCYPICRGSQIKPGMLANRMNRARK